MNYTLLRNMKDVLVVNAAGAGIITFLKTYCVTLGAIVRSNKVKIDPLGKLANETKNIITNIVSPQYCLGCCGKNSVKVKE